MCDLNEVEDLISPYLHHLSDMSYNELNTWAIAYADRRFPPDVNGVERFTFGDLSHQVNEQRQNSLGIDWPVFSIQAADAHVHMYKTMPDPGPKECHWWNTSRKYDQVVRRCAVDEYLTQIDMTNRPIIPRAVRKNVEWPPGSGVFPFSCPEWTGRDLPQLSLYIDPGTYDYSGGTTAADRAKWFDKDEPDFPTYNRMFIKERFCVCNDPWIGSPPSCIKSCGVNSFVSPDGTCQKCPVGVLCDEMQTTTTLDTLKIAAGYWRVNNESLAIRPCPANKVSPMQQ